MSWLSSFLHPGDAYKSAMEAQQPYYNEAQGYNLPYMEHGKEAGGQLMNYLQQLLNPGQLQSEWAKGYETSPYAQQMLEQSNANGADIASQQGLTGSSAALQNINQQGHNIVDQDRQQYMNDLMQKYMQGIGLGENVYGIGAQASQNQANRAVNQGNWVGEQTYNQNAAGGNMFGGLLGGAASLAGGILGGPIGGAIANNLFTNNKNGYQAYPQQQYLGPYNASLYGG